MLFDKLNIELLKFVAVCKDFPVNCGFPDVRLLRDGNINGLIKEGLLSVSKDGRRYRVTKPGYEFLNIAVGFPCRPDAIREANEQTLLRREQSAQVMLMLMLAGIDVFVDDLSKLEAGRYMHAGSIRRAQRESGRNLTGNTRFTGLMGGEGFVFYYVTDPRGKLFHQSETRIVKVLLSKSCNRSLSGIRPSVIYTGTDYLSLCSMMTGAAGKEATYRTAFDRFAGSVHLCPCTPDGALQMKIMLEPDYRKKLTDYLFYHNEHDLPDPAFGECDGLMGGEPFVLAVDMNLRRVTGVLSASRKKEKPVHVFARQCQNEALAEILPHDDVSFHEIDDTDIIVALQKSIKLTEPRMEPYITDKGYYVNDGAAEFFREIRKVRGYIDAVAEQP